VKIADMDRAINIQDASLSDTDFLTYHRFVFCKFFVNRTI